MKLINIGFGNMVASSRLIAIVSPESAPVKRTVQEARDRGMVVDGTYGRRTRAVQQLDGMLNEVKPVGRKLDFLVQEMNRETNTIGSKANDVSMAQIVVNIKSEIEKIREQIQNIE